MPASPRATRRSWVWLMSIGSPSWLSVVVAAATDVAVLDGIGIGCGVGKEGLVEAGLEDRGDRAIARRADRDAAAACGFEALRPIGLLHPQDAETGSEALLGMRLGAHDRLAQRDRGRADLLGSGEQPRRRPEGVSAMRLTGERAWLATRVPRWNTSMVASVARTSTTWRIMRDGTE